MCNSGDIYIYILKNCQLYLDGKKIYYILENSLLKEVMTLFNPN